MLDDATKKKDDALRQWESAKTDLSRIRKENQLLRRMGNVPENFDMQVDDLMAAEKDKIEDYEKLIQVIQKDNQELEKERAKLKNEIRQLTLMVNTSDTNERYRHLTKDQVFAMDQYMLRLLSGDPQTDTTEFMRLKREN